MDIMSNGKNSKYKYISYFSVVCSHKRFHVKSLSCYTKTTANLNAINDHFHMEALFLGLSLCTMFIFPISGWTLCDIFVCDFREFISSSPRVLILAALLSVLYLFAVFFSFIWRMVFSGGQYARCVLF